jgi:hypothetical protein
MNIQEIILRSNLEVDKATALITKFEEYQAVANEWKEKADSIIINDESEVEKMELASTGASFLKHKRSDIEKLRKKLKESSLREGQAIDSIAKSLTKLIAPIEDDLILKARYKEIKEAERRNKLIVERTNILLEFETRINENVIASMNDQEWENYLFGVKTNHETKKKAEQEEAELRRLKELEEIAERDRIRLENKLLKEQAIQREEEIKRIQREKELQEPVKEIPVSNITPISVEEYLNLQIEPTKVVNDWEPKWDDDSVYEFIKKYYKSDLIPEQFIADSQEFLAEFEFYNEDF